MATMHSQPSRADRPAEPSPLCAGGARQMALEELLACIRRKIRRLREAGGPKKD